MDMTEVFQTFYKQCDVKKEIEDCSIMIKNDRKGTRMIKDDTIEQLIQLLMLKSFVKGSEMTLEMIKDLSKFDEKLVQL